MKKKKLAMLLVVVMGIAALAGCGSQEPASTPPAGSDEAGEVEEAALDYPKGDVTIIIPNNAGGGNDLTTRALIPGLQRALEVNMIPMNKGEGGGAIAATDLANASPDGQTLYFNSQSLIILPHGGLPDIKMENYQPVAQVVEDTGVIYVNADAPYQTIEEFVEAAKTENIKVAHNGVGAIWHLISVHFAEAAGVDFQYVAYTSGGSAMLAALASGEIDMCITNPSEGSALVDAGRIRPLAIMGQSRLDIYADIPTCIESGIDVYFPIWRGLFTTAGVSEDVLNHLDEAIKAATESPEFVDYCNSNSLPIVFKGHKEFTEIFNADVERIADLVDLIH